MQDQRATTAAQLSALAICPEGELRARARALLAPRAACLLSAPFGRAEGADDLVDRLLLPLRGALEGCHRRDLLVLGGANRRDGGGQWVACLTHYVGTFAAPLVGLAPSGGLAFLRSGEFYRIEEGRIAEARLILDLPDLAGQSGRLPFRHGAGTGLVVPAPATQDGICPVEGNGDQSLDVIEAMIAGGAGDGARDHWADDFLRYGPGGTGSTYRWKGLADAHRSLDSAVPGQTGGSHLCRIGDGAYAATLGWPSMTVTHDGAYLGVPATGRALEIRAIDFYRTAPGPDGRRRIAEAWACRDHVDLFAQMGVDFIARANAVA